MISWRKVALGATACVWGCSSDTTAPNDASQPDTTVPMDSGSDAPKPIDAGADAIDTGTEAATDAGTVYNDMTSAANWTFFSLGPNVSYGANELQGGAFDGKYIYFAPATYGIVVRYDTTQPFNAKASWTLFDLSTIDAAAKRYAGVVWDGTYVYMIPYDNSRGFRYDPTTSFTTKASWQEFNFGSLNGSEKMIGGAYGSAHVYYAPNVVGTAPAGGVTRFDTAGAFADSGAWQNYDLGANDGGAKGFAGGGFDGKYLYLAPSNGVSGTVAQYDTTATFAAPGSWLSFDLSTVKTQLRGFWGAVFDGKYMYFVPNKDSAGTYAGQCARYDTTKPFSASGSWEAFDTTAVNADAVGFVGGQFDGRYVYFSPHRKANSSFNGMTVRFDTQGTFTDKNSWQSFNMETLDPQGHGFAGAVFDGRYVYYIPYVSGIITRFDAKTPPSVPTPTASFF